jgi:hypothetical protein
MGEKIGSLYFEIGGDAKQLETSLQQAKADAKLFASELDKAFRSTDMSGMKDQVSAFSKQLKADTPTNRFYTASLSEIKGQYESGAISAQEASRRVDEVTKSMAEGEKKSVSFGSALKTATNVIAAVTGAAAILGATFKTAFDLGLQGATVNQQTASFKILLGVIGAAPDLLNKLRTASRGTISDMSLMAATSTLLAGASDKMAKMMADAAPAILEIADAANKLNPTLGSTEFLYSSLMTGIKRGSPLLIDNTGLTVRLGEANEAFAKKLGKSVDELTAEEAKMALLNGVLAAGDNLLRQVGGSAVSLTDPFERLKATTQNLKNEALAGLAGFLADAAEAMTTLLTKTEQFNNLLTDHKTQLETSKMTYSEYIAEMQRSAAVIGARVMQGEGVTYIYTKEGEAIRLLSEAEWANRNAINSDTGATKNAIPVIDELNNSLASSAGAAQAGEAGMKSYESALSGIGSQIAGINGQIADAQADLAAAQADWQAGAGNDVAALLGEQGLKGEALILALAGVDQVMGTSLANQETYNQKLAAATAEFKKSGDLDAFKVALGNIKDEFMPMSEKVQAATDKVIDLEAKLKLLQGMQVNIDINLRQNGVLPQFNPYDYANGGAPIVVNPTPTPITPTPGPVRGGPVGRDSAEPVFGRGQGNVTINQLYITLPNVTDAQQFTAELGRITKRSAAAGIASAGR